jgi:FkbM family methyltransferase
MDGLTRTIMTIGCRDCDELPKCEGAGQIVEGPLFPIQIMHNGIKVKAGGYHGDWMAHVIRALRGHHEPQEEFVFNHLLRFCRHNTLIVELGCFWAWYSLWYLKEIPGSRAICIEPDPANLNVGIINSELNSMKNRMVFHSFWIGGDNLSAFTNVAESVNEKITLPCVNMEGLLSLTNSQPIEILHLDIQGAETSFLKSIGPHCKAGRVRFIVVSTHHSSISGSKTTHRDCIDALKEAGCNILIEHNIQESFSGDGLIVGSFLSQDLKIQISPISRNTPGNSMFPMP